MLPRTVRMGVPRHAVYPCYVHGRVSGWTLRSDGRGVGKCRFEVVFVLSFPEPNPRRRKRIFDLLERRTRSSPVSPLPPHSRSSPWCYYHRWRYVFCCFSICSAKLTISGWMVEYLVSRAYKKIIRRSPSLCVGSARIRRPRKAPP
jgi:hypothetical protein